MTRPFIYKIADCFDKDDVSFVLYPETKYRNRGEDMVEQGAFDSDFNLIGERHSVYALNKPYPLVKLLFTVDNYNGFDVYINKIMVDLEDKERDLIKQAIVSYEGRQRLLAEQEGAKRKLAEQKLLEEPILAIEGW